MYTLFDVPRDVMGVIREVEKESIRTLLTALKEKGEVFNKVIGGLRSSVIADQMNDICEELWTKHGVEVRFVQPVPGRVRWENLDELIEKYSV